MAKNLTKGNITKNLIFLAIPIMGTSFLEMAYSLTDIFWVARLGSVGVASVGTAGYYMWLGYAFVTLTKVGAEVKVAQSLGAKDVKGANTYFFNSLLLALFFGVFYFLGLALFRGPLIDFFNIADKVVSDYSKSYLLYVSVSMPFALINQVLSAVYNASGNSKLPFKLNSIGLILNMILDPLLINYFNMGVIGAAIATTISKVAVTILLGVALYKIAPYSDFKLKPKIAMNDIITMLRISTPVAVQSGLFTVISMVLGRMIATFGTNALAVQRIGTQVEAVTYTTANGFGVALSGMVGQNYGALKYERVRESFKRAFTIMSSYGLLTSILLYVFAKQIYGIFLSGDVLLAMGTEYLHILSISQVFMCVEITLAGGFNGLSKSTYPAVNSILLNLARIPFAYYLSKYTVLALNGIWWSISISSMFKGVLITIMAIIVTKKLIQKTE